MRRPRPPRFETVCRTHVGLKRELNEDAFLSRADIGLWAVADGMGGHQAGDVASQHIVRHLEAITDAPSAYRLMAATEAALQAANADLIDHAARSPGVSVIGSTVIALLIFEDHFACVWAGDSRAYRLRDGLLTRLSHDHSRVQTLIDAGVLNEQTAQSSSLANIITRAVGARADLDLASVQGEHETGDLYLLCSDGLSRAVDDDELRRFMAGPDMTATADGLIARALECGGDDNVTLILVGGR